MPKKSRKQRLISRDTSSISRKEFKQDKFNWQQMYLFQTVKTSHLINNSNIIAKKQWLSIWALC